MKMELLKTELEGVFFEALSPFLKPFFKKGTFDRILKKAKD
jgi:hypothetical protein